MNRTLESVAEEIAALRAAGLDRSLRIAVPHGGARVTVDGREAVVLASNDYLGLAHDPRLADAAVAAAKADGAGAGAARLVSGSRRAHAALESAVAAFTGAESALTFASGYAGNLATLGALLSKGDLAISDAANHASLIDGLRLSGAERRVVPHRDTAAVRDALRDRAKHRRVAIVTEGLFSMDGDIARLADLAELATTHGALLVVDDAHGFGVLGATGRGALELNGVGAPPEVVRLGTFGKAFGAAGSFVAAARPVVELVIHRGRGFVFTTAPSPLVVAAAAAGMAAAEAEPWRRERCLAVARTLRERLVARFPDLAPLRGPILPLVLGDAGSAVRAAKRLLDRGYFAPAIRPPTVPEGTARLRLAASASLTEDDAVRAAAALLECVA